MESRTLLEYFTGTNSTTIISILPLFDILRKQNLSQREIADQLEITRKVINQTVNQFVELNFIEQIGDGYSLTGSGAIAQYQYQQARKRIGAETLKYLANSQNRVVILQRLQTEPIGKSQLASYSNLPSYSTIRRAIKAAEELDLVVRTEAGKYELTEKGEATLNSYFNLLETFDQIIEKNPCLRNLDVDCADFPVGALAEEELVIGTPAKPFTQVTALINFIESLDEHKIKHIRLFSSYFDLRISQSLSPLMQAETQIDVISPQSSLRQVPTASEAAAHVKQGFEAENVHWKVYRGKLPAGLLIVDDNQVVLGPRTANEATEVSGTLYTSNPTIVEWAIELHDSYLAASRDPLVHFLETFREFGSDLLDRIAPKNNRINDV